MARGEPVIAEPEIQGGIPLESSASAFLILMSDGVYTTLEHATRTQRANADIALMVASEFSQQSTLNGVAQAVIDRIVRMHHDAYMLAQPDDERKQTCQRHDDMTLLVRSFGYPLGHHVTGGASGGGAVAVTVPTSPPHVGSPPDVYSASAIGSVMRQTSRTAVTITPSLIASLPDYAVVGQSGDDGGGETCAGSGVNTDGGDGGDDEEDGTLDGENSERSSSLSQVTQSFGSLKLDPDGRIESYVSFDEYFEAYDKMSCEEQRTFTEQCMLKVEHDSIPEGAEPTSPEFGAR